MVNMKPKTARVLTTHGTYDITSGDGGFSLPDYTYDKAVIRAKTVAKREARRESERKLNQEIARIEASNPKFYFDDTLDAISNRSRWDRLKDRRQERAARKSAEKKAKVAVKNSGGTVGYMGMPMARNFFEEAPKNGVLAPAEATADTDGMDVMEQWRKYGQPELDEIEALDA